MYYIRLLKKPRFRLGPDVSSASVVTVVTVTSDLGESFLPRSLMLMARIRSVDSNKIVSRETCLQWTAGMRAMKLELHVDRPRNDVQSLVLEVTCPTPSDDLCSLSASSILNVFSSPMHTVNGSESEGYVERRLAFGPKQLNVWEETGESIARHIWDGGFALTAYLAQRRYPPAATQHNVILGNLPSLDTRLASSSPVKLLELGSGCGIVGLGIATLYSHCAVTLSDLPLAEEIVRRNLQSSGLMKQASFITLDWENDLSSGLLKQTFDVMLVADCFYNAANAPHLVRVLTQLTDKAPDTLIVLAHKKRHESEDVFFRLLGSFVTLNRADVDVGDECYVNLHVLKRNSG